MIMLNLNVTRTEFEKRILAVIENFNGCPIGKKTKRLSLINQSLKTILHGTEPSADSDLKYNEHNLDSFFTDTPNIEDETVYMLSENYGYRNCYDNDIRTTYHNSRAAAEHYIYSEIISDHGEEAYGMLNEERVEQVLSWLTDSEREAFKEDFYFSIQDVPKDPEAASAFAQEISYTNNLKAISVLGELITESDNVQGSHTIEETEMPVRKVEVEADKEISILSILVLSVGGNGISQRQYITASDHKGEVLKMYNDFISNMMRPLSEVQALLSESEKEALGRTCNSKEDFISLAVSKLPVATLLSEDFIFRIISLNNTFRVSHEYKKEIV